MLQSMGSERVRHNLATEQNSNTLDTETLISMFCVSHYH